MQARPTEGQKGVSPSVESVTEGIITNPVENGFMETATAQDALNARPVMRFQCREHPAPKEYSPLLHRIPVEAEMLVSPAPTGTRCNAWKSLLAKQKQTVAPRNGGDVDDFKNQAVRVWSTGDSVSGGPQNTLSLCSEQQTC